jgi:threonyl-tRNA synthetase
VQVTVLPIADRHAPYARSVRQKLADAGFRAQVDERQEKIGYKIREAQLQKVPYMLVVGDREAAESAVAVRSRSGGDLGAQSVDAFIASAQREVETKGSAPTST